MRGVVVYYSRYGNNEKAAKAVAEGLKEAGHEVDLVNARQQKELGEGCEFIVVGSPTRVGKMSGPVKKFIKKNIDGPEWKDIPFAAFGTCMESFIEKGSNCAAKDIYESLEEKGLKPMGDAFDVAVAGMKGPLVEGMEAQAGEFGKDVGAKLKGGS